MMRWVSKVTLFDEALQFYTILAYLPRQFRLVFVLLTSPLSLSGLESFSVLAYVTLVISRFNSAYSQLYSQFYS